jgi:hypothetical protein
MIAATCPACHKELRIPPRLAGKTVRCATCLAPLRVPKETPVAAVPVKEPPPLPQVTPVRAAPRKPQPPQVLDAIPVGVDDEEPITLEPSSPPPRRRPLRDDDDDDYDDRPRRSRRPPPRRRSRPRRPGRPMSSWNMIFLGLGGLWVIMLLFAILLGPTGALLQVLVGVMVSLAGGIMFLMAAFQEDTVCGVLCLLLPFYSLYYLITRFPDVWQPFCVNLIGCAFLFASMPFGGARFFGPDVDRGFAPRPGPPVFIRP